MRIYIDPSGHGRMVYDELFDPSPLGAIDIRRASHVEPTTGGHWTADLSPLGGPILGPFPTRSQALAAELAWLDAWFLSSHGVALN